MTTTATNHGIAHLNIELIHEVADTIERLEFGIHPGQFKMSDYTHWLAEDCRSPACIAGWTCYIADETVPPKGRLEDHPVHERAAELLGIKDDTADVLFAPTSYEAHYTAPPGNPGHISPARAAATLRRLADTGRVDWGTEA